VTRPEQSAERDAALEALVATVPFPGWTVAALRMTAGPDADLLFPGGSVDMVEAWSDGADRRMAADAPVEGRVSDRVRAQIAGRLAATRSQKDAVRRGLAVLAMHPGASSRTLARTVDAIWLAAGDRSTDSSWYSKRALLAGVYASTLLYWFRDDSEADAATFAFLDRRLAGVGRIGRLKRKGLAALRRSEPSA
jgi:ubiquinone biosynthesis protein COQ9